MENNIKSTEQRSFKKSDLKSGDILELRNGQRCIFLNTIDRTGRERISPFIVGLDGGFIIELNNYEDNLLAPDCKKYDIMKVIRIEEIFESTNWIWERTEPIKMTLSEVCEELGKDIKIIKEK